MNDIGLEPGGEVADAPSPAEPAVDARELHRLHGNSRSGEALERQRMRPRHDALLDAARRQRRDGVLGERFGAAGLRACDDV
jgi:hypothetical protein